MTQLPQPGDQHREPAQDDESARDKRTRRRVVLVAIAMGAAMIAAVLVGRYTVNEFVLDERDPDHVVDAFVEALNNREAGAALARTCDESSADGGFVNATPTELQQDFESFDEADITIERLGTVARESSAEASAEIAFASADGSTNYILTLTQHSETWCISDTELDATPRDDPNIFGREGRETVERLLGAIDGSDNVAARQLVCDEPIDGTTSDIDEVIERDSDIRSTGGATVTESTALVDLNGTLDGETAAGSARAERESEGWCVSSFDVRASNAPG